jgi:hypothetical protein
VVLGAIAGCGRVGFDPLDAGGARQFQLRDLCGFATQTVVTDAIALDDQAGVDMATALAGVCPDLPDPRTASQDDPGILDPTTNRPLLATDDLAVLGGGDGPQRGLAYLLRADTPVVWSSTGPTATFSNRETGQLIAEGASSDTHDYALVMVVVEPIGGTRVLSASGMVANGTVAAAYYFDNTIAPVLATYALRWVLVEWNNADADPAPSAGDTFTVLGSG